MSLMLGCRDPPGHQDPQFSSVTQLCPTLCNPTDCSTPGLLVHQDSQGPPKMHHAEVLGGSHLGKGGQEGTRDRKLARGTRPLRKGASIAQRIGRSGSREVVYGELQKVPDCSFSTFSPNPLKPRSKDAEGVYQSAGTPVTSESFAKEKGPQRDSCPVWSLQQA